MIHSTSEPHAPAWPDEWTHALSDGSLKQACDAAILKRGQTYASSGAVEVLNEDPMPEPALRAQVSGSDIYTTEVWIESDAVAGHCDCPHAEDGQFCKHQVAVALIWRDRLAGNATPLHPTAQAAQNSTTRPRSDKEKRQALQDFLCGQDTSTLANKLLEFADRDDDINHELQQWRAANDIGTKPSNLIPLIDEMMACGRVIAWNESAVDYVCRAEAVQPLLQQARARDAGSAAAACLHALRCAWKALQDVDDSDGNIGGLCQTFGAEWIESLQAAGPQPASFGETYLEVRLDDPFGCLDSAAVEAAMGPPALARYRHVVAERWRQAKDAVLAQKAQHAAKVANRKGRALPYESSTSLEMRLLSIERLHLDQLESEGRVDDALALMREDLSEAQDHHQVISYLEKHGRFQEAFVQAELGIQAFPDDWRLQEDLFRCLERAGLTAEVLAWRHRQFKRCPCLERYHQVLKAGLAAGQDMVALRQSLMDFMAAQEMQAISRPSYSTRVGSPLGRDVTLRAKVLASESHWIEACALVQPPAICHDGVLSQIAMHLPEAQQEQALALLLRVFCNAMQGSSSPHRSELALVQEIGQRMDPARCTAWLAQLRTEYKAKRNFVRDLPDQVTPARRSAPPSAGES